jgi:cell division transport system permease protein
VLKFLTKADYLLRETVLGLRRGGWMNWAAISTVTVLLFLFGISLQASWQLESLLNQFGSQLEVSVYLETGVQAETLKPFVTAMPEVNSVELIPKEHAWNSLVQELGLSNIKDASQQLEGNPLVDELRVRANVSQQVVPLAQKLAKLQGVEDVQYVDEAVRRIAQLNQGLSWVSMTVTGLLTLTAIAVITTTIRLIVTARRREIEVMQLVGATIGWIYFPFILQGITFGVVGAAIAWGLIGGVQHFLKTLLAQQPEFIQFLTNGFQLNIAESVLLPLLLLGFGGSVGVMGSLFAVRRIAVR